MPIHHSLVPKSKSEDPSRPMQAFKNASSPLRCLLKLLTTSVPGLTSGALSMKERSDRTEYSGENPPSFSTSRYCTRVRSSARIVKSRMSGVASSES